jgi:hypothetical protein
MNGVLQFAPKKDGSSPSDSLDSAGNTILELLRDATRLFDEKNRQALDIAHKLSAQLRSAESRIKELESDVRFYHDRAVRAEQWLSAIAGEIQQNFLAKADRQSEEPPPPQSLLRSGGGRK